MHLCVAIHLAFHSLIAIAHLDSIEVDKPEVPKDHCTRIIIPPGIEVWSKFLDGLDEQLISIDNVPIFAGNKRFTRAWSGINNFTPIHSRQPGVSLITDNIWHALSLAGNAERLAVGSSDD